jgi:hypothetical protein
MSVCQYCIHRTVCLWYRDYTNVYVSVFYTSNCLFMLYGFLYVCVLILYTSIMVLYVCVNLDYIELFVKKYDAKILCVAENIFVNKL